MNYALVMFDTDMHDISLPGSRPSIIIPEATNEEILPVLEKGGVNVWYPHYFTKAMRVLREAGYEPVAMDGAINVAPHNEPCIIDVDWVDDDDSGSHREDMTAVEVEEDDDDE